MSYCRLHAQKETEDAVVLMASLRLNQAGANCGNCKRWTGARCEREKELLNKKRGG